MQAPSPVPPPTSEHPEEPQTPTSSAWLDDNHFWMLAGCPLAHSDAIRPFTLRFRDQRLEFEFASLTHIARHHSVDRVFALVNLVSSLLHLFMQLLGWVATDWRAILASVPFICISSAHCTVIRFLPDYTPGRHRALFLIPVRILYALLTVNALKYLVPSSTGPATSAVVIRQIFLGSGSALGVWLAFGIPMLFWQSALLALGQAAASMYATSGTVCGNLDRLPQGAQVTSQIWEALNSASQLCYEAYLPGSSRLTSSRTPSCPSVILFTQLVCGCLLPLAYTYYSEAAWRLRFLRERDPSTPNSAQLVRGGYAGAIVATGSRWLLLLACALLGLASMWEVCNTAAAVQAAYTCRMGGDMCTAAY